MGVGTSTNLKEIFLVIRACEWISSSNHIESYNYVLSGPWERVDEIINKFLVEEYQFGLSIDHIKTLTKLSQDDSAALHDCLSRNRKGM
jgi:hypothetical protein